MHPVVAVGGVGGGRRARAPAGLLRASSQHQGPRALPPWGRAMPPLRTVSAPRRPPKGWEGGSREMHRRRPSCQAQFGSHLSCVTRAGQATSLVPRCCFWRVWCPPWTALLLPRAVLPRHCRPPSLGPYPQRLVGRYGAVLPHPTSWLPGQAAHTQPLHQ